jgi:MscS family membrane protein
MQEMVNNFLQLVGEVWQVGSLGVGAGNMLGALAVFLFFAILRGLFTRFVLSAFQRLTDRTKTKVDDMLREAIERPLKFFFLVLGAFFAKETMVLSGLALELADNTVRSLIAVALFWTIHAASTPVAYSLQSVKDVLSSEIISWLVAILRWGVILTGLATILQIWGIQIAPIIAGFGLFGVAVALGAQDLFKNLLGGVSILVERRFKIGDWVAVPDVVEGVVEHIGFRSTRVRRFDKVPAIVPNNMFSDHALINYSEMTHRRIYWTIGLEYRTTKEQLQKVRDDILAWIEGNDNFVSSDELPCLVYVDSFNSSSIDMMVYCFTRETLWANWLKNKQDLAYSIKQIVEEAGSAFAFPSRSVYHEVTNGETAELFEPPKGKE